MGITSRDVDPDTWAALLQAEAAANGAPSARPEAKRARAEVALVEPFVCMPEPGRLVAVIPCEVPSLANERDWRVRNRVTQAHRKAVSRTLAPHLRYLAEFTEHLHRGGTLRITLTRLGGRSLDKHDNLPASLKYCLDGLCLLLGVDDADRRLDVKHDQQPGGKVGVRITLETVEG